LGKYEAAYHSYHLEIPRNPVLQWEKVTRFAEGDQSIGIALNGVPFVYHNGGALSSIFDDCNGHIDAKNHMYHYHMIPTCLLDNLGHTVPSNRSYWASNDPLEQLNDWPDTGKPSPMVGYALDGFAIMGPYDEEGDLQVGGSVSNMSTLDECNGKTGKDGHYRYYLTPNAPYNVACFKGTSIGTFVDQRISNAACPKVGVKSVWCDPESDDCELDMEEKCTNEPYEGPYFLFKADPKLDGPQWAAYSLFFGLTFALISVKSVLDIRTLRALRMKNATVKYVTHGFVLVVCWCRAFVFLVDPHYTREVLSPYLVGILYGLPYPALNAAIGLMLFVLYELVQGATSMTKVAAGFLPKTKFVFVSMTVGQFLTQMVADGLRAGGHTYDWLIVCQVYFICWGVLVCAIGIQWGQKLWVTLSPKFRQRCFKFFLNVMVSTFIGLVMMISSAIKLTCSLSDDEYFAEMTFMRLTEVLACCLFIYAMAPEKKLLEGNTSVWTKVKNKMYA